MQVSTAIDEEFESWLATHGASYPKIRWPCDVGELHGCRGAVATSDIESNEAMLTIPQALMITPLNAYDDPILGNFFRENPRVFDDDDSCLAVFLMHERLKGDGSFWYPFLRMLPEPATVSCLLFL